jgi:hypothetical protein
MIVDSLDIVKKYVATIASLSQFELLKSYMEAAEEWVKNDLLGTDLYDLAEKDKTDATHALLVARIQRIVSLNGFNRAVPFLDVVQTDNGFAVTRTEGLAPASKERVAALRAELEQECDHAVESLLFFLEETATYHEKWKKSPAYALLTDTFLPTFRIFKRHVPYSEEVVAVYPKGRLEFARLQGKMRAVMANQIDAVLGDAFKEELLTQMRGNSLTKDNEWLLEPARFALALYTLGIDVRGDGFLNRVAAMLKNNPTVYPTWANSDVGKSVLAPVAGEVDSPIFNAI